MTLINVIEDHLKVREDSLKTIGGCSDGNCCIISPKGVQHTNGECRCSMYPENRYNIEKALRINQIFAKDISREIEKYKNIDNELERLLVTMDICFDKVIKNRDNLKQFIKDNSLLEKYNLFNKD